MQRATAQLCGLILLLLMDIGDSMHLPASFFDNSGKEMTDDDDNDNSKRRPELSFTLQPKGLEHIMKKSLESIRHDLIQQTPLSLSTNYLDLEISLNDLRFAEFVLPELHIHTVSASRLSFKTSGGFVRLQGAYSAVYKTRRLGQFEAIFEDINAETTVHLLKEQQTLKITTAKCKFAIDQIYVNLTPKLPQQINDAIKNAIIAAYEKRACGSIENYVNSLGKKLKSVAEIVDFSSKDVNRNENSKSVQHDLIHYTVNEESVHLHWEHKTNRVPLGMTSKKPLKREYTLVEPSMITLSISDDYLNDRLNSLINSEEVKISLHKIDKVAELLSLNCKEQSIPCVGQLAKLPTAIDGTGHFTWRVSAPPTLHQDAMGVHVVLPMRSSISYYTTAHKRIRFVSFDTLLKLRIKKLSIDQKADGRLYYQSKLGIESIEITNAKSSVNGVQNLIDNMNKVMMNLREEIGVCKIMKKNHF
ncbi:hypothetical protein WR25_23566 isoform B [Diploscapter pachys]|uniref:Lipid-binding serum glycoprotein N-terminal domain-containing protein n=1 Tax=Diploscapter pachys TaxID=2018661 RepID=A0A2A2JF35_9BILA|nr:hypothetical protein WR25_23566 isoform B [Diploscapter pachys]